MSPTWLNACGKFPSILPATGSVFLCQQADVIAQACKAVEEPPRIFKSLLQHQHVRQPEAAGQEGPSPGGRPSSVSSVR